MVRVLTAAIAAMIAWWDLAAAITPSAVLLAAATLAVAGLITLVACRAPVAVAAGRPVRAAALRDRAGRSALVRLRDPDAPGRPRVRAP
ncbi:DUF6412 domain-containing protein [Actinoallomurus purpureus]|uniref:DUF6412 domain-containing protein n=1 Tax=Actinoallomurus purpureus TaxID=478114 RepID=UPI002093F4C5|nr:DUF6412 domain-containing protein [Actinoallomurus purpureus]MCO6007847.1 DUF6412 domain-containing protein [Actinoallomurus purpureus]